jgi:hypothetical protein
MSRLSKFDTLEVNTIYGTANVDIKSTSASGLVRILDDSDVPVFSYNNNTDVFTFSDTVTIDIGNKLEVNTIDTYNSINGVTVENVQINNGSIGSTGTRVTKGWFTDIEITNYPTIAGTAIADQTLRTTDAVSFAELTVDSITLNSSSVTIDSAGDANVFIDRGATSNVGSVTMQTAGNIKWIIGNFGDTASDDLQFIGANPWLTIGQADGLITVEQKISQGSLLRDSTKEAVADDASVDLTDLTAGFGFVMAGDREEWAQFCWDTSASVTLIANSANVTNTDTDGNLCIFDNGTTVRIRNRLGSQKNIRFFINYST